MTSRKALQELGVDGMTVTEVLQSEAPTRRVFSSGWRETVRRIQCVNLVTFGCAKS